MMLAFSIKVASSLSANFCTLNVTASTFRLSPTSDMIDSSFNRLESFAIKLVNCSFVHGTSIQCFWKSQTEKEEKNIVRILRQAQSYRTFLVGDVLQWKFPTLTVAIFFQTQSGPSFQLRLSVLNHGKIGCPEVSNKYELRDGGFDSLSTPLTFFRSCETFSKLFYDLQMVPQ